jgi:transposase
VNDDGTGVFVLPGFRVVAGELLDGEWHLQVETRREPTGCPTCGAVARVKDRRTVTVRDLPAGGVPVVVRWCKRVFECRYALCEKKTWTEQHDAIASRMVLTDRAQQWAFQQVGHHDRAVSRVAAQLGVSWHTIMTQVVDRGAPLVDDSDRLAGVTAVGVDETSFLRATGTRHTQYATGVSDLTPGRAPRLLDVVPGRSGRVLGGWLAGRDEAWRAAIRTASLDPFRGYATALTGHLPAATRVLDPFHVVKLILLAVDQVRRRVQQDTTGHRGHAGDPLYRARRILRRRFDRLTDRQLLRLKEALTVGDTGEEITAAWLVAQKVMQAYANPDRSAGRAAAEQIITLARTCPVPRSAASGACWPPGGPSSWPVSTTPTCPTGPPRTSI